MDKVRGARLIQLIFWLALVVGVVCYIFSDVLFHVPTKVEVVSKILTQFWNKPILLKARVVMPDGISAGEEIRLPIVYHIPGFGGNHNDGKRGSHILRSLMKRRPDLRMIHVFFDTSFPTGHNFLVDSENNGPWARAFIYEFIPFLEEQLHISSDERPVRFITGHSSGGWAALWMQINYPMVFSGVWATSPDPVDFRDFFGVDITEDSDDNMYFDHNGAPRPVARGRGQGEEDQGTLKEYVEDEEAAGENGNEIRAYERAWSHRRPDGTPARLFDRETGVLNHDTLIEWSKYDIGALLSAQWSKLSKELKGKLHIICGAADTFFLDRPTKLLCRRLAALRSDAQCLLIRGRNHQNLYAPHALYPSGLEEWMINQMKQRSQEVRQQTNLGGSVSEARPLLN